MTEAERAIREALPFATPGRWEHVFSNGGREHYVYAPDAHYRRDLPGPVKVAWLPYSPGSNRDANDAVYIAACNPENIAALLAEIDRLTRERNEARARCIGETRALVTQREDLASRAAQYMQERDEARAERDMLRSPDRARLVADNALFIDRLDKQAVMIEKMRAERDAMAMTIAAERKGWIDEKAMRSTGSWGPRSEQEKNSGSR